MSKVCENFESKLVEWAEALREYDQAYAVFNTEWPKSREKQVMGRLTAAAKRLDKLRGPMHTALDRLAKEVG
jgi:hypothetical protein